MLKDGRFLFRAVSSVLFLGNISHACGDRGHQVRRKTGQLSLRLLSCQPNYFASTNIKTFAFTSLRPLICFVFFKLEKSSLCCFEIGKALDRRHSHCHFSFQKQEKPFIFRAEVHTVLLVSVEHTLALAFQCADS